MAVSVKHAFVSGKPDGADSTLVQPSNWNAEHTLTLGSSKLLGRITSGIGAVEEIGIGSGLTLASGSVSANVTTVAGRTGAVTLAVADVSGAAPLSSPALTGNPTAVTQSAGDNSTRIATTAYADASASTAVANSFVSMGSVATTSGTSKDFSTIASTAKRVTLILQGVSLSGTALLRIQLGTSGGLVTSSYGSTSSVISSGGGRAAATAGFEIYTDVPGASYSVDGAIVFYLVGSNTWVAAGTVGWGGVAWTSTIGGHIALGGTLTQLRLTTSNGTDTFDAGSANVFYE
jgi:hypothetical protein